MLNEKDKDEILELYSLVLWELHGAKEAANALEEILNEYTAKNEPDRSVEAPPNVLITEGYEAPKPPEFETLSEGYLPQHLPDFIILICGMIMGSLLTSMIFLFFLT